MILSSKAATPRISNCVLIISLTEKTSSLMLRICRMSSWYSHVLIMIFRFFYDSHIIRGILEKTQGTDSDSRDGLDLFVGVMA